MHNNQHICQQCNYINTNSWFFEPFDFILHDMNGIDTFPGLSKMQQCPEKTIQLEPFCYPNQKTKQGIFDKKKFY